MLLPAGGTMFAVPQLIGAQLPQLVLARTVRAVKAGNLISWFLRRPPFGIQPESIIVGAVLVGCEPSMDIANSENIIYWILYCFYVHLYFFHIN